MFDKQNTIKRIQEIVEKLQNQNLDLSNSLQGEYKETSLLIKALLVCIDRLSEEKNSLNEEIEYLERENKRLQKELEENESKLKSHTDSLNSAIYTIRQNLDSIRNLFYNLKNEN